jgi:hypothetical protein
MGATMIGLQELLKVWGHMLVGCFMFVNTVASMAIGTVAVLRVIQGGSNMTGTICV